MELIILCLCPKNEVFVIKTITEETSDSVGKLSEAYIIMDRARQERASRIMRGYEQLLLSFGLHYQ